jgi:hypothetical protein
MVMDPDAVGPMVVMTVISISVAAVIILRGPVGRALGKRLEGNNAPDSDLVQRVEELETRLLVAEQAEGRLAEVEERLDFAERLLAGEKKAAQVQGER